MNKISKTVNIEQMTVKDIYALPSDGPVHDYIASILQTVAILTEQNYRDIEVATAGDDDDSYSALSAIRPATEQDLAEVTEWQRKTIIQYLALLTSSADSRINSLNYQIDNLESSKVLEEKLMPERHSEAETGKAIKRLNYIGNSLEQAKTQLKESKVLLENLRDIQSKPETERIDYAKKQIPNELRNRGLDTTEVTFNL